jgi:FkbM family methyltransferase
MVFFRSKIRFFFDCLGYTVRRKLKNPVIYNNIDLVFDIGANTGHFVKNLRAAGYVNRVVSFEPLSSAYNLLLCSASNDKNWQVHSRCALGSEISDSIINISNNSHSSSILPMLDRHKRVAPDSFTIGSENIKIITIDSIFQKYSNPLDKIFLKIDTQGFEHKVLEGCLMNLSKIFMVQLELSTTYLYKDQKLVDYFFSFFSKFGFRLWSIEPILFDYSTGEVLQFDAIFINSNI